MKKATGIADTFLDGDEHERDTAQRAYPKEVVEGTKRTMKLPAFDPRATQQSAQDALSALRTVSGTRPAITSEAIEEAEQRAERANLEETFHSSVGSSLLEDAHSRPTMEIVSAHAFQAIVTDSHSEPRDDVDTSMGMPTPAVGMPVTMIVGGGSASEPIEPLAPPPPLPTIKRTKTARLAIADTTKQQAATTPNNIVLSRRLIALFAAAIISLILGAAAMGFAFGSRH